MKLTFKHDLTVQEIVIEDHKIIEKDLLTIPDIFIKLIDVVEIEGTKLFKIDLFQIG